MVKIAILGHGVVGSGVYEVIEKNKDVIARGAGDKIEVKYILDKRSFPDLPYNNKIIGDYGTILNDKEVTVVAEMLGGLHPAYEFTRDALKAGKSVVTSNKEVVAAKGAHLLKIARDYGVSYLYEASVGGGIPLIHPLCQCFHSNHVEEIAGILNGTTNYVLTQMVKGGKSFDEALLEAQQNGYAEANPDADVLGIDTCRKICILGDILSGKNIDVKHVYTEGITNITLKDIAYASKWGAAVKLVGRCRPQKNGKIEIMVTPCFVPEGSPLYAVEDVFNGVMVRGDMVGDVMFYGRGAGKLPTASAVVSDIIEIVKCGKNIRKAFWEETQENIVEPFENCESAFFIRIKGGDDRLKAVNHSFGESEEIKVHALQGESGFITGILTEKCFQSCLTQFEKQYGNMKILSSIRVLG